MTNFRETEILLDGKLIAFADHRSRNLSIKLAFESSFWQLQQSQLWSMTNPTSMSRISFLYESMNHVAFCYPSLYANFAFQDSPM